jgi:hypothetical protein
MEHRRNLELSSRYSGSKFLPFGPFLEQYMCFVLRTFNVSSTKVYLLNKYILYQLQKRFQIGHCLLTPLLQPRVHKFDILFTPQTATVTNPSAPNLIFTYLETIRFFGPDGTPCTGLDADPTGFLQYDGFPVLPAATYVGDGFGNAGPGGKRIAIDAEGLILNSDGSFWVSDGKLSRRSLIS